MAVTTIPLSETIGGAVGRFGEEFGDVLDKTVFAKGLREKELRKDPAAMQALLFGAKQAELRGPESLAAMAKGLNVNVEFLTDEVIAGFSLGADKQAEFDFIQLGGPAKLAATSLSKAIADGKEFDAAIEQNVASLFAELAAGETTVALNALKIRRENGVQTLILDTELIAAEVGLESARKAQEIFASFDQSTPEGRTAAAEFALAQTNPSYLTHIGLHEQLQFQADLAFARTRKEGVDAAAQIVADKESMTERQRAALNLATDRLQEAIDVGNEDFRNQAVRDLNGVVFMIQELNEEGLLFPIDTSIASIVGKFPFGTKVEFAETVFRDTEVAPMMVDLVDQGVTDIDEAIKELGSVDIEGNPLVDAEGNPTGRVSVLEFFEFSPRDLANLREDFPKYLDGVLESLTGAPGIFTAGTVGGEAIRGLPGVGTVKEGLRQTMAIYNIMSEEIKAVLDHLRSPVIPGTSGNF